jgi:hypothetical protein
MGNAEKLTPNSRYLTFEFGFSAFCVPDSSLGKESFGEVAESPSRTGIGTHVRCAPQNYLRSTIEEYGFRIAEFSQGKGRSGGRGRNFGMRSPRRSPSRAEAGIAEFLIKS